METYKIESDRIRIKVDEKGDIVSLLDKKGKINPVREKNIFNRGGLQIWVKEGRLGRDAGGNLSHKFSDITFKNPSIRIKDSSIYVEKREGEEVLNITYNVNNGEVGISVSLKNKGRSKLQQFEFFFNWEMPSGTKILIPDKNRYKSYTVPPFGRVVTKRFRFYPEPIYFIFENGGGLKIEFSKLGTYVVYNRGKMCVVGGYTDAILVKKEKQLEETIKIMPYKKKIYTHPREEKFVFPEVSKNPWFKKRLIHLSLYYQKVDIQSLFFIFRNLKKIGYNGVVLGIGKGMRYESYPQVSEEWSYTKIEVREIKRYLEEMKMEIIPEFPTLGHQNDTNLVRVDPSLVEDPENPSVYCTSNPKTYKVIFSLLDEIIEIFRPDFFHLTHDEVQHWFSKRKMGICEKCKDKKLWEIYSEDVNRLNKFLQSKGIRMTLWGDMLLDHRKFKICNCNGASGNIYKSIDLIPKDILIFDWHYHYYREYPSLDYFRNKGFDVFPAMSFFRPEAVASFSRYSKKAGIRGGAIETTWAVPVVEELPLENIFIASQLFQNPYHNMKELKKQAYQFAMHIYKEAKK